MLPKDVTFPAPFFDPEGFRLMMLGDIMGDSGVEATVKIVPILKREWNLDFIIANGENSNGFGMMPASANKLLNCGIDVITGGNHTFRPNAIHKFLNENNNVLRPLNIGSEKTPGNGFGIYDTPKGKIAVLNLIGQVFMDPSDNPFAAFDRIYETVDSKSVKIFAIDFHAEATGEKMALSYHADSKASIVAGTHTHVLTADERIQKGGTAAISDLGLCGSKSSIIGMEPKAIIRKSLHGLPSRLIPAKKDLSIQGIVLLIDPNTGNTLHISRINIPVSI